MLNIPTVLQSAVSLHQSGRLTEASSLYQQILQCNPRHPVALHFMGMIAFQTGDYKLALDLTEKSIKVDSKNPLYFFNRGIIYNTQGDLLSSVNSYRQAITLNPNYSEALFNLGNTLVRLGNKTLDNKGILDEAEACFRKLLTIKPSYDAHQNLAMTLEALGRLDEALEHFGLSLNPEIDWDSELKHLTTPMVLLDDMELNYEKLPQEPGVELKCNYLEKQEAGPAMSSFPMENVQEPCRTNNKPDVDITKKLKIVLIYPPPWQIPQPGEAPLGTPFDPPKDWKSSDFNEDTSIITYGLLTLAAQAKRSGHDVSIHNLSTTPWKDVVDLIASVKADIYGISSFTFNRRGMGAVAALIRQYHQDAHVTVGGPFATALPRETLKFFRDIATVVIGEGEETFRELLGYIGSGHPAVGIPGTAWRDGENIIIAPVRKRINDLDVLTSPFDYFPSRIVMTSRGCPGKCSFCGSYNTWGYKVCFHSVDYCLDMFKKALNQLSLPFLGIKDDTFTSNRRRAISICDAIVENKVNFLWSCDTRVDFLDEELLGKMRLAGCQTISLGVESGSPEILKTMRKKTTPQMILKATRIARKYGFNIRYYMIILNRGESVETINQSTELIRVGRPTHYVFSPLSFNPGTKDYEILCREQNISEEIFFRNDFAELAVTRKRKTEVQALLRKVQCDIGVINGFNYSIEERESVVNMLPNLHSAHVELANAYFRAGRFDEAAVELDVAEELCFPIDVIIKNQQACMAIAKNDPETALALLEKGLQSSPCRILEKNHIMLKKWASSPTHMREKVPTLNDSISAMDFVSFQFNL